MQDLLARAEARASQFLNTWVILELADGCPKAARINWPSLVMLDSRNSRRLGVLSTDFGLVGAHPGSEQRALV